jgi:CRISPR/Cas system-associated exonuclease Cas4 (RecB family)
MIQGDLEHMSRYFATEDLQKTYFTAKNEDELRNTYAIISDSVQRAIVECERKYSYLGYDIEPMSGEILNRLRIEEDIRVVAATNLMRDGVRGLNLVCQLLPQQVELPLRSESYGLEGRLDALCFTGSAYFPVEYKTGRVPDGKPRLSHELQLTAYCMLLEENLQTVCHYGEIYYTRYFRRVPVFISDKAKDEVLEIRDKFLTTCTGSSELVIGMGGFEI